MKADVLEGEEVDHEKCVAPFVSNELLSISQPAARLKRSIRAETYVYAMLAIGASMFLVFALLAASVHNTFPGFNIKYRPGHPVASAMQLPSFPELIILPNATAVWSGHTDNGTRGLGMTKSLPSTTALNHRLREAAQLGPTIFPILFAGIVGSTLRLVARWRAEQGSSIEVLEVLLGSTSLASTLSTLFSLRTLGTIELGLVLLWALSPLAGQASLRVLETRNVTNMQTINFPWVAVNPGHVAISQRWLPYLHEVYIGSLLWCQDTFDDWNQMFSDPNMPTDVSHAPLIPLIAHDDSWTRFNNLPFADNKQPRKSYTSFIGLRVEGPMIVPPVGSGIEHENLYDTELPILKNSTASFTISHFEFNCPSVSKYSLLGDASSDLELWTDALSPNFIYANSSKAITLSHLGSGFFLDTNYNFTSQDKLDGPQNVLFVSFYKQYVTLWNCSIFKVTRNVTIFHQDTLSNLKYPSRGVDYLESVGPATVTTTTPFTNSSLAAGIFGQWPVMDAASVGISSLTEQYLALGKSYTASLVDVSTVDNITFATRLTTVFNTYLQLLQSCDQQTDVNNPCEVDATSSTPLQLLPFTVIVCNWAFFAILTFTSTVLIICASVSIWLSHRISTPDIMGYVSSLAIDNPHIHIPRDSSGLTSTLNGLERSKVLRDVKVQVRDVQQEDPIGKFALTSDVRPWEMNTQKDREYA